eukprot:GHVS01099934.1.p1 GENE.GHVS01099934.1~~GHVS01099934.1.p1  ORF type:complete len:1277 (-),score=313.40 GHVS01099934.1:526-4356(-)
MAHSSSSACSSKTPDAIFQSPPLNAATDTSPPLLPLPDALPSRSKQTHFTESADFAAAPPADNFLHPSPPPPPPKLPIDHNTHPLPYCFRGHPPSLAYLPSSSSCRFLSSSPTADTNSFPPLHLFSPPRPSPFYQHRPVGPAAETEDLQEGQRRACLDGEEEEENEGSSSPGGATCGSCFGGRSNRSAGSTSVKTPRTARARLPFLASTSSTMNSPSALPRMFTATTMNAASANNNVMTSGSRSVCHRISASSYGTNSTATTTNTIRHTTPYYTPHNNNNRNVTTQQQQLYRSFGLRCFCFPSSPMHQTSPLFCNIQNAQQQQLHPSFFPASPPPPPSYRTSADTSTLPLPYRPKQTSNGFLPPPPPPRPPPSNLCFGATSTREAQPPLFSIFPPPPFSTAAAVAACGATSRPVVPSRHCTSPPPLSSSLSSSSPGFCRSPPLPRTPSPPASPSQSTNPSSSSIPSSPTPPAPFPPKCPPLPLLCLPARSPPGGAHPPPAPHLRPSARRPLVSSGPPSSLPTPAETATTETAEPSADPPARFVPNVAANPPLPPSNKNKNSNQSKDVPAPVLSSPPCSSAPQTAAPSHRSVVATSSVIFTKTEASNDEYDLQFGGVQIKLHKKLSAKCHCQFDVWEAEATSYVDYQEVHSAEEVPGNGDPVSPVSSMLQGRCKTAVAERESLVETHKQLQANSITGNGGRFALKLLDMDSCDPAKLKYKTHSVLAEGRQLNELCRQMWSSETQTYLFGGETMHVSVPTNTTAASDNNDSSTCRGSSGSSGCGSDAGTCDVSRGEGGGGDINTTSPYSSTSTSPASSPNASPTPTVSTTASAGPSSASSSTTILETAVANKQIVPLRSSAARPCRTPPNLMPIPRYLWTADGTRKKDGQRVLGVAMEMIQGRSLTHLLQQLRCPMKPSAALLALEISVKIVESQRVLAEKLHRPLINWDTKPGNIILELSRSSSGRLHCRRAVIVDLGDALPGPSFWFPTRQRPGDTPGYIICTKGYCSPECALLVFLLASSSRCAAFRKVWYSDKVSIEQLQQTRKLRIPHRWKQWIKHGYLKRTPTPTTSNIDGTGSSSIGSSTVGPATSPIPGTSTAPTAPPPSTSPRDEPSAFPSAPPPPLPAAPAASPAPSTSSSGSRDRGCWEILFSEKSVVFSTGLVLAQLFGGPNLLQVVEKDEVRALDLLCEWGFKGTSNLFSGLPNLCPEDLLPSTGVFAEEQWRSRLLVLLEGCLAFLPVHRWTFKQVSEYLHEFYQDYFNAYQQAKVKALLAAQQ